MGSNACWEGGKRTHAKVHDSRLVRRTGDAQPDHSEQMERKPYFKKAQQDKTVI